MTDNCSDGDIRLQGGTSELEGRVEICHIGMWSRVCGGDSWESKEANIVCRQLGFRDFGMYSTTGLKSSCRTFMFLCSRVCIF